MSGDTAGRRHARIALASAFALGALALVPAAQASGTYRWQAAGQDLTKLVKPIDDSGGSFGWTFIPSTPEIAWDPAVPHGSNGGGGRAGYTIKVPSGVVIREITMVGKYSWGEAFGPWRMNLIDSFIPQSDPAVLAAAGDGGWAIGPVRVGHFLNNIVWQIEPMGRAQPGALPTRFAIGSVDATINDARQPTITARPRVAAGKISVTARDPVSGVQRLVVGGRTCFDRPPSAKRRARLVGQGEAVLTLRCAVPAAGGTAVVIAHDVAGNVGRKVVTLQR